MQLVIYLFANIYPEVNVKIDRLKKHKFNT